MNSIISKNQLMQVPFQLTTEMKTDSSELYKFSDKTPSLLSTRNEKEICGADFEKYFETLKDQLLNHIETHSGNIHCNHTS